MTTTKQTEPAQEPTAEEIKKLLEKGKARRAALSKDPGGKRF